MMERKTIQHNSGQSWASPVITSEVVGREVVKLSCGVEIVWYEIEHGWVSVPMRLRLDKGSKWMETFSGKKLLPHMECYETYLGDSSRAKFTDITPEEEATAAALVMAYRMGIE